LQPSCVPPSAQEYVEGEVSRRILTLAACASCGYPSAKTRNYQWGKKAIRRKTTGSGRMRYLKTLPRRAKNGFRTGTATPASA